MDQAPPLGTDESTFSEDNSIRSAGKLKEGPWWARYSVQVALSVLVILFAMGCVTFDLFMHGTMTAISNVAWPTIGMVIMLHFNIKNAGKISSRSNTPKQTLPLPPPIPPRRLVIEPALSDSE